MQTPEQLVEAVIKGDRRAIARAISIIENKTKDAQNIMSLIYPKTGRAQIIGITGPGGAGKSTLVEKIVRELRSQGKTVGVIAVDPTSPFSGGAFLGDRIRMQELSTDEGVFIRSMATRNNPGGLAKATKDAARILDAAGKEIIIIETVGAGQSEVAIIKIAQTIIVVLAPGLGDEIQAIKAGMMEIGDIFVVNKADRNDADKTVIDIQTMIELGSEKGDWTPKIVKTIATTGDGTKSLLEKIKKHQKYLKKGEGQQRQKQTVTIEFIEALKQKTAEHVIAKLKEKGTLEKIISKILVKDTDPLVAADQCLDEYLKKEQ